MSNAIGVRVFSAGMGAIWAVIGGLSGGIASAQSEPSDPGFVGLNPPAAEGASSYRLVHAGEGLILAWLEPDDKGVSLMWSRLSASGWSEPRPVIEQQAGVVANWADVPAVAEGGDGILYAHWLRQSGPGGASYDIVMQRSADGGATWTELGKLNDDDVKGEHGFVSYVPVAQGLRAYWLDGREAAGGHGGGEHAGKMTLRTALVGEAIGASDLLDDSVCDCCNTAAAMTPGGPIVAYRDRESGEIRDIAVAGEGVGAVIPVHEDGWVMPGCPVNGPAMAASGSRVVVAWFTGAPAASVKAAFSDDGGRTFGDAVVVDDARDAAMPLGRVDVVLDGDEAIACWLRNEHRRGALLARRVGPDGPVGEAVRVASMDGGRQSGFPQVETLGERVIFVWRDVAEERLHAAALERGAIGP